MRHLPTPLFRFVLAILALTLLSSAPSPALDTDAEVLGPELLWQLVRVSGPAVSPDGTTAVFPATRTFIPENDSDTDLWTVAVEGGEPTHLTELPGTETAPRWRPDGERIGFLADRTGSMQLWEIRPDGTDLRRVTDVAGGISHFLYAPTGDRISFTRDVKLDRTASDVHPDLPEADARIVDELMYRHWDRWHDFAYSHLFVAEYDDGSIGEPRDLMSGERYDTPLNPFGGVEQIAWSPDGRKIAYTSKKLVGTDWAVSTDSDVFVVHVETGVAINATDGMEGYDVEPRFSPDGGRLAWLSMEREGYESDRNRLFVVDVVADPAKPAEAFPADSRRELTAGFDGDAHGPAWSPDGASIYFTGETGGTVQLFAADVAAAEVSRITDGIHDYRAFVTAGDGTLVAARQSMSAPTDLYRVSVESGEAVRLTDMNRTRLEGIELGRVEKRMVTSTDGTEILAWVIYPPGFDPEKRYPALLYCQGGPQSPLTQFFSYRWNFQIMAAHGYVVVAPNRRGVPGFGQEFKEQISGDWGGQAMDDLLAAIDDVAAEAWIDEERLGAVGASFGGYTVYWLAGHHEGRFRTFIAHAGVFDLESMYGATEEIFFVNWDLGGPYWREPRPESYDRFSPHAFVGEWETPMLVIHGQRDFRVPVTQGMQAFTALQLQGIESRFLYFPEEGHWILSPQNGILWQRVFFDWLDRYLTP